MEQRDQTPQQPGEDIGRAAAEAAAEAEAGEGVDAFGDGRWHRPERHGSGPDGPERRSKRWLVVGGVTVVALALAGGAAAIAGGSHHTSNTTAQNVAATDPTTQSPEPPATSQQSPTAPTTPGTPSTPPPTSDATTPSTPAKAGTPTPGKSPTPPTPTDETGGACENTSHDTAADRAVMFSGMTEGTQQAFLNAKKAAEADGLGFVLNSGYRSAAYQKRIFDCYVKQLGSAQAARTWALPPDESAHVKGYAMDIAPPSAAAWLESTAGKYGLCRRFADETWHFEYQARYKTQGCPALLPHP